MNLTTKTLMSWSLGVLATYFLIRLAIRHEFKKKRPIGR